MATFDRGKPTPAPWPGATVRVARDEFDVDRSIDVLVETFANPHPADECGGKIAPLTQTRVGGYIPPSLIPEGAPFGHHGSHRRDREIPIKVLVQEDVTHPAVVVWLKDLTKDAKLSASYTRAAERRRREGGAGF